MDKEPITKIKDLLRDRLHACEIELEDMISRKNNIINDIEQFDSGDDEVSPSHKRQVIARLEAVKERIVYVRKRYMSLKAVYCLIEQEKEDGLDFVEEVYQCFEEGLGD